MNGPDILLVVVVGTVFACISFAIGRKIGQHEMPKHRGFSYFLYLMGYSMAAGFLLSIGVIFWIGGGDQMIIAAVFIANAIAQAMGILMCKSDG